MASLVASGGPALARRIYIPLTATSPAGLVEADTVDPWIKSGKYGLAWTYFSLALLGVVMLVRMWHLWQDKIRQAIYKQEVEEHYRKLYNTDPDWDRSAAAATSALASASATTASQRHFFPEEAKAETAFRPSAHFSSIGPVNDTLALFRWIFYRPIPDIVLRRRHRFTFSSLAVLACGFVALAFVTLYCFLPQPLYWQSIQYGSPPLAVRAGMFAVAMTPWILAASTKANVLTLLTGIGPERLNVLHRWAGYLCLFLSLVHAIPFYVQPVWDDGGMAVFQALFPNGGSTIIYGTGISCLVPLIWLCVASLPVIRRLAYEVFRVLHVPVGLLYVGLLFWHTKNYLASWGYLYASVAIFAGCQVARLAKLNWVRPWRRSSFLVGDEAAITLLAENAIKITIPTQMRWRPGQYVYLRMPGISLLENHPFTVSSLCSDDFPSAYGDAYRDCVLVFRPYGGFTRRVLESALDKGPFHTYRAFLDGPYGGMRRELAAFDTVILIAGGSGITSLMSQLLNLIKRMRDGKAITKKIVVVWALRRLEAMDWFREELRICREAAPPESVTCKFFVTSATRAEHRNHQLGGLAWGAAAAPGGGVGGGGAGRAPRPLSNLFHDRLDGFVAGIASKRNSALIAAEAQGDPDRERELRAEDQDRFTALPQSKHLQPWAPPPPQQTQPLSLENRDEKFAASTSTSSHIGIGGIPGDAGADYSHFTSAYPAAPDHTGMHPPELAHLRTDVGDVQRAAATAAAAAAAAGTARPTSTFGPPSGFDFGFPATPTDFQKSLMRFAFPVPHQIDGGWSVEYGRPDLGFMLREWATGGSDGRGILGRRTAVFVCGPASMRVGVANTVARLQAEIWGDDMLEEIFLHTENYSL